jgi:hypothetical protein
MKLTEAEVLKRIKACASSIPSDTDHAGQLIIYTDIYLINGEYYDEPEMGDELPFGLAGVCSRCYTEGGCTCFE